LLAAAIGLSACAGAPKDDPPISKPKSTVPVETQSLKIPDKPLRKPVSPKFKEWLNDFKQEALSKGIRQSTIDIAFDNAYPIRRVIELDRNQPEFKLTYQEYMDRVVPYSRVLKARKKLAENRTLLEKIGKKYGVQPRFLVAFWGVETDFGRTTGTFPIIRSVATLAHDGRRSSFFRKELMDSLRILDEGHIAPDKFKGSWAGAMGQCQFMPSTFVGYAVDEDGDGRKDLWESKADVFASAANYLSHMGWNPNQTWGRPVSLPKGFDKKLANGQRLTLKTWSALGVSDIHGKPLPHQDIQAALVFPDAQKTGNKVYGVYVKGPAFLVYNNYYSTLKWNRSTYYALAIGQLADAIAQE